MDEPHSPLFGLHPVARLRRLLRSHELLRTLVVKDLRAHYKNSALGFLWALVNPLLMMGIYTAIFVVIAKVRVMNYPALLLSGLVPWSFFASTLHGGTGALADNANLVKKLRFPREVLPASVVAANALHFALALLLLVAFLLIQGLRPTLLWLGLPLAAGLLVVFALGIAFATSSLNPVFHDVRFLVSALASVWFFATPIVYPREMVPEPYASALRLNPMTGMIELFQGLLVTGQLPDAGSLAYLVAAAMTSLWLGLRVFGRFDGRLADLL